MAEALLSIVVWAIVLGIIGAILYAIINAMPLQEPFKRIALLALLGLLLVVILLKVLPLLGAHI